MNAELTLNNFLRVINSKEDRLRKYVTLPNSNQTYIDMENEQLKSLTHTYNVFNKFKFLSTWHHLENEIKTITDTDPQIGFIQIILPLSTKGKFTAQINLCNPTKDERV